MSEGGKIDDNKVITLDFKTGAVTDENPSEADLVPTKDNLLSGPLRYPRSPVMDTKVKPISNNTFIDPPYDVEF